MRPRPAREPPKPECLGARASFARGCCQASDLMRLAGRRARGGAPPGSGRRAARQRAIPRGRLASAAPVPVARTRAPPSAPGRPLYMPSVKPHFAPSLLSPSGRTLLVSDPHLNTPRQTSTQREKHTTTKKRRLPIPARLASSPAAGDAGTGAPPSAVGAARLRSRPQISFPPIAANARAPSYCIHGGQVDGLVMQADKIPKPFEGGCRVVGLD
jgi:hypothetical protein